MRRELLLALLLGLGLGYVASVPSASADTRPSTPIVLDLRLNGTPIPLGLIYSVDGGTINNQNCPQPFNRTYGSDGLKGKVLYWCVDAPGRILPVLDGDGGTTEVKGQGNTGKPVVSGECGYFTMNETHSAIAWKPSNQADGGVEVWEMR